MGYMAYRGGKLPACWGRIHYQGGCRHTPAPRRPGRACTSRTHTLIHAARAHHAYAREEQEPCQAVACKNRAVPKFGNS